MRRLLSSQASLTLMVGLCNEESAYRSLFDGGDNFLSLWRKVLQRGNESVDVDV